MHWVKQIYETNDYLINSKHDWESNYRCFFSVFNHCKSHLFGILTVGQKHPAVWTRTLLTSIPKCSMHGIWRTWYSILCSGYQILTVPSTELIILCAHECAAIHLQYFYLLTLLGQNFRGTEASWVNILQLDSHQCHRLSLVIMGKTTLKGKETSFTYPSLMQCTLT